MNSYLISLAIAVPFFGALVQFGSLSLKNAPPVISISKWISIFASLLSSGVMLFLITSMNPIDIQPQFVEVFPWIDTYAIKYEVGLDGLSTPIVLLLSIVFPVLIAAEWGRKPGGRGVHGILLLLQGALLGTILSYDLFLTAFFWGLSILPAAFLVGIWGQKEGREAAAIKLIVTGAVSSAFFIAALLIVYFANDPHSFSLREIMGGALEAKSFQVLGHELSVARVCFGLLLAALALRAPIWPISGWAFSAAKSANPHAFTVYSSAVIPTVFVVFLRLTFSLFPETTAASSPILLGAGILNLLVGSMGALGERRLVSILCQLSIAWLGFALIGMSSLTSPGVVGAVYSTFAFGLSLCGFGLFSGVIWNRFKQNSEDEEEVVLRGLASVAPKLSVFVVVVVASLISFPGLIGFVSGTLVLIGSYSISPMSVMIAFIGMICLVVALFRRYRDWFLGGVPQAGFVDIGLHESIYLLPVFVSLIAFGVYPKPMIDTIRPTIVALLSLVK